jgi:hypothetical protein
MALAFRHTDSSPPFARLPPETQIASGLVLKRAKQITNSDFARHRDEAILFDISKSV